MIDDLETALEVEAARAGSTEGEATTVLKARAPRGGGWLRRRRWRSLVGGLAVLLLAAGGGGRRRDRDLQRRWRRSGGRAVKAERRSRSPSATDYDPQGDGERAPRGGRAGDRRQPAATGGAWTTETYETGPSLGRARTGVGIYLDAGEPVAARTLEVRSAEGGWDLKVYGSARPAARGRLDGGRGSERPAGRGVRDQTSGARHRGAQLPLLPALDHQAGAQSAAATGSRSPTRGCSARPARLELVASAPARWRSTAEPRRRRLAELAGSRSRWPRRASSRRWSR